MRILAFTFLLSTLGLACGAEGIPLHKLAPDALARRLEGDARTVQLHRDGLRQVIAFLDTRPDLFPTGPVKAPRLFRREEKEVVWNTWQRFLDNQLALGSLEEFHRTFYRLKGPAKEDSYLVGDAAMVAGYRAALEFISRTEWHPEMDKVLNDEVPELGLPRNTYARLKTKTLNIAIATEFTAREVMLKTFPEYRQPDLRRVIQEDGAVIWKSGRARREALAVKNAFKIIQDSAHSVWLPVQTGVSEWMGDTKVYRAGKSLISAAQIDGLQSQLLPGDILLERREWFLSNIGLPGFWSHAALYVGTPAERRRFFNDPATLQWLAEQGGTAGDFEDFLRRSRPEAYETSLAVREAGHRPRVLEAMSEGVCFTTLEHSADCDSLAVLRPRLSRAERARALVRAFHYAGRPYDFDFDFATDAALVCTELVYKAYEPATGMTGLDFPLIEMLGRKVTPANELAKQFDAQFGGPRQQFELVRFLDGNERKGLAVEASVSDFRASWKRPKWHVVVQP